MSELTREIAAQTVRDFIRDIRPGGVTLEVVEDEIFQSNEYWRVPVRPSEWPHPMFRYYEVLAEIESDIVEKSGLNILLMTGEPAADDAAVAEPAAKAA